MKVIMRTPYAPLLRTTLTALAFSACAFTALAQPAQPSSAEISALITRHYTGYSVSGNPGLTFSQTTSPNWANCGANGTHCQSREELVGMLSQGFHKLIPDMKWEILDMIVTGDKVIVRGQGSGTPLGPFMGVPASGKSFKVMSIDIHTLKDGKISHTHHLEDWAAAVAQLSGK
jgi:predicted ester cyclase